jgi:PQQ-dependent dehydrogenase (methanol/ethanol family)
MGELSLPHFFVRLFPLANVRSRVHKEAGELQMNSRTGDSTRTGSASCRDADESGRKRAASWLQRLLTTLKFVFPIVVAPALVFAQSTGTNYSSLTQIDNGNVSGLKLVLAFRTGERNGYAGAPAASENTIYFLTSFPHTLFALELRPHGAVKWRLSPAGDRVAEGFGCCDGMGAGPILVGDRLYANTLDGHVLSLDAADGHAAWSKALGDLESGETLAFAPVVVGRKVLVGNGGDDFGVRGWLAALDAETGKELWRRFSTGPDNDVGISAEFHPFYVDGSGGADIGMHSWPPSGWQHGGGGLAGPLLTDPELGLVFQSTGHPAPWNPDQRPGNNRWTSGLFGRDIETGLARWFVPLNPHDLYAVGAGGPSLLVDGDWQGQLRKLLIHLDNNGYLYVLDRARGEILSAAPFVPVNATRGVDIASGQPLRNEAKRVQANSVSRDVCPARRMAASGAAYSPDLRLLFVVANRLCMDFEARDAGYIRGTPFAGANVRFKPAPAQKPPGIGALIGWDLAGAKPSWTAAEPYPLRGGVLATAGNVVFYGTTEGDFKALDARSGEPLWKFHASAGIMSQPVTFLGADGRQYVCVLAGMPAKDEIDVRDATADQGLANAVRNPPRTGNASGSLYVFVLP